MAGEIIIGGEESRGSESLELMTRSEMRNNIHSVMSVCPMWGTRAININALVIFT